jgi:hypothetical protein
VTQATNAMATERSKSAGCPSFISDSNVPARVRL